MRITYRKNELASDIRSMEERGIETDVAKELAEFNRLIDCAANTWYDLLASYEDNAPVEVAEAFGYAHELLEQAYYEIAGLFPQE